MIVGNQFSRALVLLKAKSVQERLGDNFYAVFDADYLLVLERGLLVQVPGALDLAGDLSRSGFRLGVDFGLGRPGEEGFVACEGIAYGGFGVPPCSTEPWTEDCLPDAVRSRRRTLEDHRRRARETVEQSALDAACDVAAAEGIPTRIQDWARRQPSARWEIGDIVLSVRRLRAFGVAEPLIGEALASERFLQDLFRLKQAAGMFPEQAGHTEPFSFR